MFPHRINFEIVHIQGRAICGFGFLNEVKQKPSRQARAVQRRLSQRVSMAIPLIRSYAFTGGSQGVNELPPLPIVLRRCCR